MATKGKGTVPEFQLVEVVVPIVGTSPLLVHRFSEKAATMMLSKHMGLATAGREVKEPTLELLRALYLVPGHDQFGFPGVGFKSAAVRGGKALDEVMSDARSAFRVTTDLVEIIGVPELDVQPARNATTMDIRIRPRFDEWAALVPVAYNAATMSAERLTQLFRSAGFGVGIGDWRQERGGTYGSFTVAQAKEVEAIRKRTEPRRAQFFVEHAQAITRVREERGRLWEILEREAPEVQVYDEAKRVAEPRARRGNGAHVEA